MSNSPELLAKLAGYDFIVVLDASGSMDRPVKAGSSVSRWTAAQESVEVFARDMGKLDSDGIDVVVFNGAAVTPYTGVTVDKVREIFASNSPRSSTPLAEALTAALALAGKSDKKDFILVLTDGEPDDKAAAAKVIVDASNSITADDELTFLFIQVGDDAGATAYLKQLDDNLTGAKHDIVDTMTVAEADKYATTADMILAGIDG